MSPTEPVCLCPVPHLQGVECMCVIHHGQRPVIPMTPSTSGASLTAESEALLAQFSTTVEYDDGRVENPMRDTLLAIEAAAAAAARDAWEDAICDAEDRADAARAEADRLADAVADYLADVADSDRLKRLVKALERYDGDLTEKTRAALDARGAS